MPSLHPQIQEVLRVMTEAKLRPIEELTPAEAREQMEATARARKAEPLPVARVAERMIPGPAVEIRLRGVRVVRTVVVAVRNAVGTCSVNIGEIANNQPRLALVRSWGGCDD